jgi:V-type H+-transporting ATPase subunit a
MFRSEEVSMVRVYISPDIVRGALEELGKAGLVHFMDEGTCSQKKELEKLKERADYLLEEVERAGSQTYGAEKGVDMEAVEREVNKHFYRMVQLKQMMGENAVTLERLREDVAVLQELNVSEGIEDVEFEFERRREMGLEYVAGVISSGKMRVLEEFLWRALHGNMCFVKVDVETEGRSGFICFTHGDRAIKRVHTICVTVEARIVKSYLLNGEREARKTQGKKKKCRTDEETRKKEEGGEHGLLEVSSKLSQMVQVAQSNRDAMEREIKTISREVNAWRYVIAKEREIERVKGMFMADGDHKYLQGTGYILRRREKEFGAVIQRICNMHGEVAAELVPIGEEAVKPTFIETNEITEGFQAIINTYGTPAYQEINPAAFAMTTFPLLFGSMFGDVGHGLIVMSLGMFLVMRSSSFKRVPDALKIVVSGRWLILAMGFWAVFFGFLYSDFLSRPIHLFSSPRYNEPAPYLYPFGVDPVWHHASNSQAFLNSVKMKLSVLFGFAHLSTGLAISAMNSVYKKNWAELLGCVLPQMIVFFGSIGYLSLLILVKWDAGTGPSLLNTMIEMFRPPFEVKSENLIYRGQQGVQKFILLLMLFSVPWMVFAKPIYATVMKKNNLLDIWMHQSIGTLEFCIGIISNISSYLRIWAVSLAHSELSSILYDKCFGSSVGLGVKMLIGAPIWAIGTFVLLIALEGMSACLHSLRLHWVEFGSKFFAGTGTPFSPLSFQEDVLMNREEE